MQATATSLTDRAKALLSRTATSAALGGLALAPLAAAPARAVTLDAPTLTADARDRGTSVSFTTNTLDAAATPDGQALRLFGEAATAMRGSGGAFTASYTWEGAYGDPLEAGDAFLLEENYTASFQDQGLTSDTSVELLVDLDADGTAEYRNFISGDSRGNRILNAVNVQNELIAAAPATDYRIDLILRVGAIDGSTTIRLPEDSGITLTVIPEPATAGILGVMLGVPVLRRRRPRA